MYGALLGDILGSKYEFIGRGCEEPIFFIGGSAFTDDSVCTGAIAKMLHMNYEYNPAQELKRFCVDYPTVGYGPSFRAWIYDWMQTGYNSYGNGAIMRISPCAIYSKDLNTVLKFGKKYTEVSHNPPDALLAVDIYLTILHSLLNKKTLPEALNNAHNLYGFTYATVNEYKKIGGFHIHAIETLQRAVACVNEANSFQEAITKVIQIGSDTDTTAAVAGAMAEIIWGIPDEYLKKLSTYFQWVYPEDKCEEILDVVKYNYLNSPYFDEFRDNIKTFTRTSE